jgi:glycosyltransferase involved in cell wall biosynthesis
MPSDAPPSHRQLNVLEMCTEFGIGGIARHVLDLRRWLNSRGHRISLAGTSGPWAGPLNDPDFLELATCKVSGSGGALVSRLGHAGLSAMKLRRWMSEQQIDLIHAHESAPALVAHLARLGRNIPLIVTYHGSEPERIRQFGSIARHANLVITPSQRSAEDLATIGRVPRQRLRVIGLGINQPPDDDPDTVAALRDELIGDGTRLVVIIARLTHQKGIDILIDCVERMMRSHPDYRFVVVGDGPLEAEMRRLADSRNVSTHLQFVGRSETPYRYLRAADMMLLTSRWEALPISIVEALQTGTPVVATACSGVVELVDEQVGACVPIGDVKAICQAVSATLGDGAKLDAMSKAALERSKEDRFDPDWVHREFETTYLDLVRKQVS